MKTKENQACITVKIDNEIYLQRAIKRISQEDLAKAVGVTRQTIGQLEKNNYNPSLKLAVAIANYFDMSIYDIFSFEITK